VHGSVRRHALARLGTWPSRETSLRQRRPKRVVGLRRGDARSAGTRTPVCRMLDGDDVERVALEHRLCTAGAGVGLGKAKSSAQRRDLVSGHPRAHGSRVRSIDAFGASFALANDGFLVCWPGFQAATQGCSLATGRKEAQGAKHDYRGVVVSPDGRYALTDQSGGAAPNLLWEVEHRELGGARLAHVGQIRGAVRAEGEAPTLSGAVFCGDGSTAVTALPDDGLFVWELPPVVSWHGSSVPIRSWALR
jgi:hypothetical protein